MKKPTFKSIIVVAFSISSQIICKKNSVKRLINYLYMLCTLTNSYETIAKRLFVRVWKKHVGLINSQTECVSQFFRFKLSL